MRYFMDISYHGKSFHGWQKQKNAVSVQEVLEDKLSTIFQMKVDITGSGRTDTGVHAKQQIAHFDITAEIDEAMLRFKLNTMLPGAISVNDIIEVKENAHARFDAVSRTYHYFIHTEKDPFLEGQSYYFRSDLDLDMIKKGCLRIKTHKDFQCFSKVKTEVNNFLCDIHDLEWEKTEVGYVFRITANRFLRGMVRAIVGTLIELGQNKLSLEEFDLILVGGNRSDAGHAAPPEGLFLLSVTYPESIYL